MIFMVTQNEGKENGYLKWTGQYRITFVTLYYYISMQTYTPDFPPSKHTGKVH